MAQIEDAGPELIQSMKPETPVHMMRPMDSPGPPTIKPICRWTEQDDLTLIAVLKAELQRNPTPANGFRGSTWPTAAQALAGSEVKTGSKAKDPTGCRSRYSSLKRSYLELKHLRSMAEARWDEHVKRVILPEEIWASFLANSSEKGKSLYRWRQKRFPLYNQVSDLIDGHLPVADGPKQAGDAEHPQLARPILSAPPSAKRRRITHEDMFLKHLKEIGDNLKSRPSLRVEAIRLLQLDGQLSEPELLKAIDYLGPLEHAETYIALEPRLRTTWIRTKLGDVRPL
ncbi:hypothetical protein PtA15_1A661 [Puccinia triticina]|uniref:Myb/SANT-like domain-containing protein n=1 Tax=Puccinia triticina TaxID=208348 RepID=A0ABY7C821_9BASI|nr:uncharacterized protein PtA15_1A661 [Puccinia triticina]WAQ81321.1 hypothetical protein PtA15_1A661 [Puccinia triticina]